MTLLVADRKRIATEIAHCKTLYEGFDAPGKMIQALGDVLNDCAKRQGGVEKNAQMQDLHGEEPEVRLARGESLNYHFTVNSAFLTLMLQNAAKALGDTRAVVGKSLEQAKGPWNNGEHGSAAELTLQDVFDLWQLVQKTRSVAPDLTSLLFSSVLSRVYQATVGATKDEWDLEPWHRGSCPVCGQRPHYGQLLSEQGTKVLECWLCGTQWNHTRLQCPFCELREHDELGYFVVEGRSVCRVQFCRRCSQYYKIFDTRDMINEDILLSVHHLASLEYDVMAEKEGFRPGSGLSWMVGV